MTRRCDISYHEAISILFLESDGEGLDKVNGDIGDILQTFPSKLQSVCILCACNIPCLYVTTANGIITEIPTLHYVLRVLVLSAS